MYSQQRTTKKDKSRAAANRVPREHGTAGAGGHAVEQGLAGEKNHMRPPLTGRAVVQPQKSGISSDNPVAGQLKTTSSNEPNVAQLNGDKHYWCKTETHNQWQYVGSFKNHAEANEWLKANKNRYNIIKFGQGNSATKYR
jgi:hypothetical protein